MIWKITYTNTQMWQNEANSGVHLPSLSPYIQSDKQSSLLGCNAMSLGGQLAAFWSIMVLSEHQDTTSHPRRHESCTYSIIWSKIKCSTLAQSLMMNCGFVNSPEHPRQCRWSRNMYYSPKSRRCSPTVCVYILIAFRDTQGDSECRLYCTTPQYLMKAIAK
jgi:hypothetical protein